MENGCHIAALSMQCAHCVCVSPYVTMLVSFSAHWIIWRHLPSPWIQTSNITVWARRRRTTTGFIRACLQKTCIRPCRDTKMHGAASSCEWSCLCITINTLKLLVITSRPFYIFFLPSTPALRQACPLRNVEAGQQLVTAKELGPANW